MKRIGKDAGSLVAAILLLWTCTAVAQDTLRQPESLVPPVNNPACDETESGTDLFCAPGAAGIQDTQPFGQLPAAGNASGQGAANLGFTGGANANSRASSLGAASAGQAAAPFMIGDLFGTGASTFTVISFAPTAYQTPSPNGSGAGLVGTMKISENTSPLPRDRVFFNYSYFDDVPLAAGGAGVNRYTPGFEKTFFNRMMSFEMQVPSAAT